MVWGFVNAFPFEMDGATVVVMVFTDITEQIRAEIQLRESDLRARTIIDSVVEGVIVVDGQENVTLFNPSACTLTGIPEQEALGATLQLILRGFAEQVGDSLTRQGIITRRSGAEIDVELLVAELEESTGWVYTFRDVREQMKRKQEQATLDKASSVGVLAGGIAHDFNNLLTAVYGNVALAEHSINEPEKALEFLKQSSESIQLATNLTKQLLTFSTGSEPVRDVFDTEALICEAARFALSGSSAAVTFKIAPDVESIEVDKGQMQQAIGNIFLNATQAMNDGGTIRVRIDNEQVADQEPEFVRVRISDDGPGIPTDHLSKLFDPYFTTKDSGTGLGLATTHSIVVKHGGSMSVESTVGLGTTFTLLLPRAAASNLVDADGASDRSSESRALRILVMDDEEIVLKTICHLLEHLGHEVVESKDGSEAIDEYVQAMQDDSLFDFVVMDLTVSGGMGGRVAAAEILKIDTAAKLVVSSGYSADAELARYRELGFCAKLEKPFRTVELEKLIAEIMPTST